MFKLAFEGRLNHETSDFDDGHDSQNQTNSKNQKNHGADNLPKGWRHVTLGDVWVNVEYGSATKSKKAGNIPVLRMGNFQNEIFNWEDLVYSDDKAEIEKYTLKKNDMLFNRTNSAERVGKTAIYRGERPAIFTGYLIRINRKEELIDAQFLTYYLNSLEAKRWGYSQKLWCESIEY